MNDPDDILDLFTRKGALAYAGEGVSQLEHAWQCGQLARAAEAPLPLQLASWLHDLGHLLGELEGTPTLQGQDDRHQHTGADLLEALWGPEVAEPVRLHVGAKRYLVACNPAYGRHLSADSVRSLALQGGPMGAAECHAFAALPHALQAQQLRAWDDAAKRAHWFASGAQQALQELETLMRQLPRRTV